MFRIALGCLLLATPAALADGKGTITGSVDCSAAVKSVVAIDRDQPGKPYSGTIDAASGVFTIKGLPLGVTYDVVLDCGDAKLEGVNLKVPRSDYEEEQPLTKDDIATVEKIALSLNKFENEIDVLGTFGNIQHAAVVLNKRRTTPFYGSKPGEIIWRLEVWRFERPEDHWVKRQDELATVHYRKRLKKEELAKNSLTLEPALGGIELSAKRPEVTIDKVKVPDNKPGVHLRQPMAAPKEPDKDK